MRNYKLLFLLLIAVAFVFILVLALRKKRSTKAEKYKGVAMEDIEAFSAKNLVDVSTTKKIIDKFKLNSSRLRDDIERVIEYFDEDTTSEIKVNMKPPSEMPIACGLLIDHNKYRGEQPNNQPTSLIERIRQQVSNDIAKAMMDVNLTKSIMSLTKPVSINKISEYDWESIGEDVMSSFGSVKMF